MIDNTTLTDTAGRVFDLSTVYYRDDGSYVLTLCHEIFGNVPFHVPNEGEFTALHAEVSAWRNGNEERFFMEPEEQAPTPTLDEVKARKLAAIDAETSASILAGFQCEATPPDNGQPELLHFSYDEFDQQNFADAAISMQLASASGDIPTATPWNAYRGHTEDSKGELVILHLTAETFLPIYAAALTHKATQMAIGGQRKAAVAAAQTVEDVEAI